MIIFDYITRLRPFGEKIIDFFFTSLDYDELCTQLLLTADYVVGVEPAFDGAAI